MAPWIFLQGSKNSKFWSFVHRCHNRPHKDLKLCRHNLWLMTHLFVKSENFTSCGCTVATFQNLQILNHAWLVYKTRFFDEDVYYKWSNFQGNISSPNICDMQNFKSLACQEVLKIRHNFGSIMAKWSFFYPFFY